MIELETNKGYKFCTSAYITVNDKVYVLDELNNEQRSNIGTHINHQAMQAACVGRANVHIERKPASISKILAGAASRET